MLHIERGREEDRNAVMFALLAFPFANESVQGGYYTDMPPYSAPSAQSSDVTADGYQLAKCGRLEPCGRIVKVWQRCSCMSASRRALAVRGGHMSACL